MQRKVIKQGKDTLTITLPRGWTKKYDIFPGDELNLEEQERSLILTTEKGFSLQKTIINTKDLDARMIWRKFGSAYRTGYDEIHIIFDDPKKKYPDICKSFTDPKGTINTLELIQNLNRFIGIEIIDQKATYCKLKDLGKTNEAEFDNALRRIFLLLLSISSDTLEGIKNNDKETLLILESTTDTNIDRFSDFCLRILNKKGYKDFKKTSEIYSIILLLEFLGDEYKYISKNSANIKLSNFTTKLIEELNYLLKEYYELFFKYEEKNIEKLHEKIFDIDKKISQAFTKANNNEKELFFNLHNINNIIKDLIQLTLDLKT